MEIIRIPASYFSQLEYLSDKDFNYVMKKVFELCNWRKINIEKSLRGWIVLSIYREAVQMENKARAKKWEKSLEIDIATLMSDTDEPLECDQEKKSNITSSQENSSKDIVANKFATLQELIKQEFDLEFLKEIYNEYWLSKDNFQEECNLFLEYRIEKKPNWKKEKWEMEKTFNPKLRFRTWMKNNKKWNTNLSFNNKIWVVE